MAAGARARSGQGRDACPLPHWRPHQSALLALPVQVRVRELVRQHLLSRCSHPVRQSEAGATSCAARSCCCPSPTRGLAKRIGLMLAMRMNRSASPRAGCAKARCAWRQCPWQRPSNSRLHCYHRCLERRCRRPPQLYQKQQLQYFPVVAVPRAGCGPAAVWPRRRQPVHQLRPRYAPRFASNEAANARRHSEGMLGHRPSPYPNCCTRSSWRAGGWGLLSCAYVCTTHGPSDQREGSLHLGGFVNEAAPPAGTTARRGLRLVLVKVHTGWGACWRPIRVRSSASCACPCCSCSGRSCNTCTSTSKT